mgnify:CR=1 FL=1
MFANNEIGTIQPIKEIGEIAHEHGILFHTDAVQAFGQVPINVDECHIDMLSASGHKLTDLKELDFFTSVKGLRSAHSFMAELRRENVVPEQKMYRESWESEQQLSVRSARCKNVQRKKQKYVII